MAQATVAASIENVIREYLRILRENNIPVYSLYLFGSHAKGAVHGHSDIDLAVFWDQDEIDGYDEDVRLMQLTRSMNACIEPHSFSRKDLEHPDPFVQEIISTGARLA
ncbi:MAG: nucleotidyltransferase domain-containing protein [Desulfovibrionales bacterium]|nr:MAG: nucleotidyltransferase domain-containing protein [Desulfovibrionales bacterium]